MRTIIFSAIFVIQICAIIFLIKSFVSIFKLYKIGVFNFALIISYIILNIFSIINGLSSAHVIKCVSYISTLVFLFILYRLLTINIEINCNLKKGDKTFRYYHQKDKRWKKIAYGASTIGYSGCSLAVAAMVQSAVDKDSVPSDVGKWINENFRIEKGTPNDCIVEYFNNIGLENKLLARNADLYAEIKNGAVICVSVRSGFAYLIKLFGFAPSHSVLLFDIKGEKAYIADPDNYSRTIKPMRMKKLLRKVNELPESVAHPFISVYPRLSF